MTRFKSKVMENLFNEWEKHCRTSSDGYDISFIESQIRAAIREYDAMVNVKSYEENDGDDCPPIIERFSRKQALAAFGIEEK